MTTLRGDVEGLIARWSSDAVTGGNDFADDCCGATEGHAKAACAVELRATLSRHADEVSVPRDVFLRLVALSRSAVMSEIVAPECQGNDAWRARKLADIAQADAILGETK